MGEVKIKSGNLFVGELEQGSFNSQTGEKVVTDTRIRSVSYSDLQAGTYTINCSGSTGGVVIYAFRKDDLSFDSSSSSVGWRPLPLTFTLDDEKLCRFAFRKIDNTEISPSEVTDIQLLEGTYTSETIPEYQPYFLNKPAHQVVNGQWVDIPTHHYTNNRWQGELTSQSPLKFRADGEMLDWRVEGKTNPEPETIVYGIHIDPSIQDPSNAVTYLEDAVGMTPASMGSTTFNSGSWADAFFMPKPCMVRYDGTVDYYLDPADYSKKADGTPSDVDNINHDGNAMMEWPLIWYKYDTENLEEGEVNFYVSNEKVDDRYHCWCNYDADGNIIPHFYTAIYNGTSAPIYSNESTYSVGDRVTYSSKEYECNTEITAGETWDSSKWTLISNTTRLRSLSGVQLTSSNGNGYTTGTVEVNRATANNTTTKTEWYTDILADRELINMLLVLIGKSLNAQAVFGRGLDTGGQAEKEAYVTGTLDDKGLFWGVTTDGNSAVKVFGMENYWGCVWHRVAGMVSVHNATTNSNTIKIKLTHSTVDGTDVSGFNSNGNGYIDNGVEVDRVVGLYIRKMKYFDKGYLPLLITGGSPSTYYSDYVSANYDGTSYLLAGGHAGNGLNVGSFYFSLSTGFSYSYWDIAAALSLKPRAKIPYEPYGGVGDWDETEQKYKIPVTVRGSNLYSSAWEQGFWSYDTGAGWGTDSKYVRTAKMSCKGNTKYEFVCSLPDGSKDYGFVFWDTNGNYIGNVHSSDVQNTPVKYSVVSPANAKIMAVNIARYSDGERHSADILSFDLYELHEVNIYTDHQLMDGDSIDFTTDQTEIPIATGNNTLTVDTTVKPKSVFVKFEG